MVLVNEYPYRNFDANPVQKTPSKILTRFLEAEEKKKRYDFYKYNLLYSVCQSDAKNII